MCTKVSRKVLNLFWAKVRVSREKDVSLVSGTLLSGSVGNDVVGRVKPSVK